MTIFKGRNRVTQPFSAKHGGIDIVGDDSKQVRAVSGGTVDLVQYWDGKSKTGSQSYGNLVRVKSGNTYFYYAHLAKIFIKKGATICAGDIIGTMGNTGNSFGAHTHFEVRKGGKLTIFRTNPAIYCDLQNKKGTYISQDSEKINAGGISGGDAEKVTAGAKVALNGVFLYVSSTTKNAAKKISGNYYIYDGKCVNGRYRITNAKANVGKQPAGKYVTGWVEESELLKGCAPKI